MTSAQLRLPQSMPRHEKQARVEQIINELVCHEILLQFTSMQVCTMLIPIMVHAPPAHNVAASGRK